MRFLFIVLFILIIFSCKKSNYTNQSSESIPIGDPDTSSLIFKYNNTLFTIPSPFQVTSIIKNSNIDYNKSFLSPPENVSNYTTIFKQSLNIGIYGTDMGYLNIYDQVPDIISYFTVIKKLSGELGLNSAFQASLIDRVEKNIDNQDSLLYFLTNTYREFDSYLKNSNRKDVGILIVTGGWIESLYLLAQITDENKNRSIINRLGEQKHPLDNLIELLSPYYYKSKDFSLLIDALVDLAYEFDGIIFNYTYQESEVIPEQKLSIIKSNSNVIISEYHIRTIAQKISAIRNSITQ
ncbi:MAG: hypothetical protein A2W99_09240 [Bacteroidetes bacterium GWF2_33_16]|nr:MAG: hypothetical protein A2X00_07685 [Bacteroidetes bacterium GWE2_32_14]OFY03793.1 MAG: hypothetical protein A2W99_09240 [Bacteroidetes bacterium GWF2_33_16]